MNLKFLARGDVQQAVAELQGNFAQLPQMRRRHPAGRTTNPQHVGAVLALLIHARRNADDAELAFIDRAEFELRHHILKFIQLGLDVGGNPERPGVILMFAHMLPGFQ